MMDGKKKLEELVASIKGHPDLTTRFISAGDIRSISDAFKAMEERVEKAEAQNKRLCDEITRKNELLRGCQVR